MVKIKLTPIGKKRGIKYRLVVAEENSKITGAVIANLGYYFPAQQKLTVDRDQLTTWLGRGAQPTEAVRKLLAQ